MLSRPAAARPADAPAGLPRIRWSQWYEELRDRADVHALATWSPPALTLAPLDASRASAARAGQVTALLGPAGITTITVSAAADCPAAPGDGGTADARGGDGAPPGPASVVVVCGSPDAGPDEVRAAVDRARGQGASTVVVAAGDPQAPVPGAAERIIDDMDVLAFCGRMLDALGVRR
jgi:hypothetical protein